MYTEYQPLSKKPDVSTYVPLEIAEAQKQAIKQIPIKILENWDEWVAKKVSLNIDDLWKFFSSEQIDSIGICVFNFWQNKNFIVGDETGIGKGRILSGISRWAWSTGKKVLFFTEREHLITEFWKDLHDTNSIDLVQKPVVFHSKSTIFNPDGTIAFKGTSKLVKLIEKHGFHEETNLVLTNYSQVSLKQHKKTKKNKLEEYCKNAIIILDECHNATGDSNTKKIIIELIKKAKHVVFSSATFIKDESQLDLYQNLINFDKHTFELFKRVLKNDNKRILRKVFTYELTKSLQFWRREHQPLNIEWQTIVCEDEEYINKIIQKYSEIINGLFFIVNQLNKDFVTNSWFAFGALINRLSRNLLLILKLNTLVKAIQKSIAKNHKAIIVIDSTLSSLIKKITTTKNNNDRIQINEELDNNEKIDEKNYVLNFQQAILYIIDEVLKEIIINEKLNSELLVQYEKLKEKSKVFADLSISPIDTIIQKLADANIKCGEISGRTFCLNKDGHIEKLTKIPKTKIVNQFNNGELDVLIITRAGASGISLHASAAFSDQRIRDLYELEITNRPTYRLQFIGRVNRKNQVAKPLFYTIITKLPFEQRILNLEQRKLKTLRSHISGDDEKMGQENIYNFYNEHTDKSAYLFLLNHPHLAYQMGINLKYKKSKFYYIDSILKRCIVLNIEQQNAIYDYLIYSIESYVKLQSRKNIPLSVELKSIKTFWHNLDKTKQEEFRNSYISFPELSINQFKFPWVGLMHVNSIYRTNSLYSSVLKAELQKNLEKDSEIKTFLEKVGNTIITRKRYDYNFIYKTAIPLLKSLHIGSCITIKRNNEKIFGYIHDIEIPKIKDAWKYEDLILIRIKTINPHLHHSIYYANEDYYIALDELIESDLIEISNIPINWSQFDRPEGIFIRSGYFFIGHPVYMQFLQQIYKIGEVEYFKFYDKNQMCVILPHSITEEKIMQFKKPIYQADKIAQNLISKQIMSLTTSWEPNIKAIFKLKVTTSGFNFFVATEALKNYDIIDFSLKKKLQNFIGSMNGYYLYFIQHKDIRNLLWMLEQRNVVWFVDE